MDDKTYYQEIVPDNPFPGEPEPVALLGQPNPAGTFTPSTTKEKTFPIKRIAVELLSTALNTRSRKILQEFQLEQSGGFQIGNFQEGISGDTRITPDGLVMRNKAGLITLAQDGDTGDAFFAGQLRANTTIVADTIITERASNGNGRIVFLNGGIAAILIGDPS